MTDSPKPKKIGRPRVEIDELEFEKLCEFHSTQKEIAAWFRCTDDTINAWCKRTYKKTFSDVWAEKAQAGKASLRRAMFQKALDGNIVMQIWLSKQALGMAEKATEPVTDASMNGIALKYRPGDKPVEQKPEQPAEPESTDVQA